MSAEVTFCYQMSLYQIDKKLKSFLDVGIVSEWLLNFICHTYDIERQLSLIYTELLEINKKKRDETQKEIGPRT